MFVARNGRYRVVRYDDEGGGVRRTIIHESDEWINAKESRMAETIATMKRWARIRIHGQSESNQDSGCFKRIDIGGLSCELGS